MNSSDFRTGRSRTERVRLAGAFLLGALAVLFAVLNVDEVPVNWILVTSETPLIVVIVVCLLIGGMLGFILARRRR